MTTLKKKPIFHFLFFKKLRRVIYAIAYVKAPIQSTILNPMAIASMIVRIGASTERQPFIAHAHGINDLFFSPRIFRPVGKGIPIRSPSGIRIKNAKRILTDIGYGEILSEIIGRNMLYAIISDEIIMATAGLLKLCTLYPNRLPIPELIIIDARTVAIA